MDDLHVRAFREDCLSDLRFMFENDIAPLYVEPQQDKIRPVKLRKAQLKVAANIDAQWQTKGYVRLVVEKDRRVGNTTVCCGDGYRQATGKENFNVVIGAHEKDAAARIHRRMHIFYNHYPSSLRPERWGRSTSYEEPIQFRRDPLPDELMAWDRGGDKPDFGLGSSISFFTYGSPLAQTGGTFQYLLMSEFAKAPPADQEKLVREVFPTVLRGTGAIIIESTAEKVGDTFHSYCARAQAGKSDYEFVFIGWLDDPEQCWVPTERNAEENFYHWMQCKARNDRDGEQAYGELLNLNPVEVDLLQNFIIPKWATDPEEATRHPMGWIDWRRWSIEAQCNNRVRDFNNQYPTTWRDAFLISGVALFDLGQIAIQEERITTEPPPKQGELLRTDGQQANVLDTTAVFAQVMGEPRNWVRTDTYVFQSMPFGKLSIFRSRELDKEYIVSSDYAEGESENADYNTIHVYERQDDGIEQVAHWRAKLYSEEAASEAIAMGAFYGLAWQIPEKNSCGASALALLRALYPLGRVYRRRPPDNAKSIQPTDLMGWAMSGRSKQEAIAATLTLFKHGKVVIHHPNTLHELSVFDQPERGSPRAREGKDPTTGEHYHDDEVTCVLIAVMAHRTLPYHVLLPPDLKQSQDDCLHPTLDGLLCTKCGKRFEADKPLTFEDYRNRLRKRRSQGSQASAEFSFWTKRS